MFVGEGERDTNRVCHWKVGLLSGASVCNPFPDDCGAKCPPEVMKQYSTRVCACVCGSNFAAERERLLKHTHLSAIALPRHVPVFLFIHVGSMNRARDGHRRISAFVVPREPARFFSPFCFVQKWHFASSTDDSLRAPKFRTKHSRARTKVSANFVHAFRFHVIHKNHNSPFASNNLNCFTIQIFPLLI